MVSTINERKKKKFGLIWSEIVAYFRFSLEQFSESVNETNKLPQEFQIGGPDFQCQAEKYARNSAINIKTISRYLPKADNFTSIKLTLSSDLLFFIIYVKSEW